MAKNIEIILNNEVLTGVNDLDIMIQMSIKDVQEPSSISSFYSYDFSIPGTKVNNSIFKYIFEINSQNSFKPNAANNCELRVDSVSIFNGRLQLNEIVKNNISENEEVFYDVTLYSYTKSLFNDLNGKYLSDLDFSEFAHKRTQNFITSSFTHTYLDGYVYPIIDYNIGLEWNNSKFTGRPDIGYPSFGLTDIYPAVFVKTIIDKIFETAGFQYKSDLFETDMFKKLIIPYGNHSISSTPGWFYGATGSQQAFKLWNAIGGQNAPYRYLNFNVHDTAPYYSQMNSYYHAGDYYISGTLIKRNLNYYPIVIPGTYHIKLEFDYYLYAGPIHNIYIGRTNPGVGASTPQYNNSGQLIGYSKPTLDWSSYSNLHTQNIPTAGTGSWQHIVVETTVSVAAGDLLFFFIADADMNYSQGGSTGAVNYLGVVDDGATLSISYGDVEVLDDNVYLENAFPENVLITDFLSDLNKMFNLYWDVDKLDKDIINIQTYDNYYNFSGKSYFDWNYKLDLDREFKVTFLNEEQKMVTNLKYANSSDYYNKIWEESYGLNELKYGQKRLTYTGNTFNSEIYDIDLTVMQASVSDTPYSAGASLFVAPCYWTSYHQGSDFNSRNTDIGMRILFYGGMRKIGPGSYDNWNLNGTAGYTSNYYPYAGAELIPYSAVTLSNYDLNFESSNLFYEDNCTDRNLYTLYWKNYWDMILNDEVRIVYCRIKLEEIDIYNINMNDIIILKEAYWRILEIKYNVGDKLHEVKLIKVIDELDYTPKILTTSVKSQKPKWNIIDNGTDNYIRGAYTHVSGSWNTVDDTISTTITGRTHNIYINGTRNYVGPANYHFTIDGSENTAYNNINNSSIVGSYNTLGGYNYKVSVIGNNNYVQSGVTNSNLIGDNITATTSNTTYYGSNSVSGMTHNDKVTGNDGGYAGFTYQQPFNENTFPSSWYNTDLSGYYFLSGDAWIEGGMTKNSTIVSNISQMQLNWTSMYPNSSNPMTTWNSKTWIHTLQSGSTIRVFKADDIETYGIWILTDFYDYPGQDSSYFNMTFLEGTGQFNNGDTLVVGYATQSSGVTISISDYNPSTGYTNASGGNNIQIDFTSTGLTGAAFSYTGITTTGSKDLYVSWSQYNKFISNVELYYSLGLYGTEVLATAFTYDLAEYDTLYWKSGSSSLSGQCGFNNSVFSAITSVQLNYTSSGETTNNALTWLNSIKTGTTMTMYKLSDNTQYETFTISSIIDASWDNYFSFTITPLYGEGTITTGDDIAFQSGSTPTWHRYNRISLPIAVENQPLVNLIWRVTGATDGLFNFDDFEFYSRPTYYHLDFYDYVNVRNISGITIDLSAYWTSAQTMQAITGATSGVTVDLSGYLRTSGGTLTGNLYGTNIYATRITGVTISAATLDAGNVEIFDNTIYWTSAQTMQAITGATSGVTLVHNSLSGLQGGSGTTEFYHLSYLQYRNITGGTYLTSSSLNPYWTSAQTIQYVTGQTSGITVDLSNYYTKTQVNTGFLSANTSMPFLRLTGGTLSGNLIGTNIYATKVSGVTVSAATLDAGNVVIFNTNNYYTKTQSDSNYLSANTSLYTRALAASDFLSANTAYLSQSVANSSYLSANTSYYTQAQANSSFLSASTVGLIETIAFQFNDLSGTTGQTYIIDLYAPYGYTVNSASLASDTGTGATTFYINTTPISGLSGSTIQYKATTQSYTATGNNTVAANGKLSLQITAASGPPTKLYGSIKTTRT